LIIESREKMICNFAEKIKEELVLNGNTIILTPFRDTLIVGRIYKENVLEENGVLFLDGKNAYPLLLKELKNHHSISITYSKDKNLYVGKIRANRYDEKALVLSEGTHVYQVLAKMNQELVSKENMNLKPKMDYLEIRLREMANIGSFYGILKNNGLLYGKWVGYQNEDYYVRTKDSYLPSGFLEKYSKILHFLNNGCYLFVGFGSRDGLLNARLEFCTSDNEESRILHKSVQIAQVSDKNIFAVLEQLENALLQEKQGKNFSLALNRKG